MFAKRRGLVSKLENGVTLFLVWMTVPFTLFYFWFGYIPKHDWCVTFFHVILTVIAIGFGIASHWITVRTLRGEASETSRPDDLTLVLTIFFIILLLMMPTISSDTISQRHIGESNHKSASDKYPYKLLGVSTYLDIRGSDVSAKPTSWTEKPENAKFEIAQVKGADLQNRNLRNMVAEGAFFVKARLYGADLRGAKLAYTRACLQTCTG
jgi:hypothetical protein